MSKVLVIGIDGLDSVLFSRFEKGLPHLRKLKEESPEITFKSVFPPDTPTAWASIYTGLNPAKHGVVYFVDPLERVALTAYKDIDNSSIRGRTFWDIAGKSGKKVCILLPELGHPVWPVNGIMTGRSRQRYSKVIPVQAFPPSLSQEYDLSSVGYLKWEAKKKSLPKFISAQRKLIDDEASFGLKMLKEKDWDLFFFYFSGLDWLGHNMWSYFDENDPVYPGPNPYKNLLEEFYRLYDGIVGDFIDATDPNSTVVLLSDHGFCMRPLNVVNINEMLRRKGFLVPKIKKQDFRDPYYDFEFLKGKIADFVNKYGAGTIITRILHTFPWAKRVFTSPLSIDWDKTSAYVSDLSGIKAYYYGGIIISKDNLGNNDYEEMRSELIEELKEIKEPDSGDKLVKWICRREELYQGEYILKYPDIIFQLREDYGAGWALFEPILSKCHTHNIQPGSHRIDTPMFMVSNTRDTHLQRSDMKLEDVAPTVLHLLGVEGDFGFDGSTILE